MKPTPPPRFPKAIGPTSLHGALVRSLPSNGPVSQVDLRRRSHGAPAPRSSYFGRFPERSIRPLHRVPAQPIRFPLGCPNESTNPPHRPPARVEHASSLRLPETASRAPLARDARAHGAHNRRAVSRASIIGPTARGPGMRTASSHGFPHAHTILSARLPMLEAPASHGCPREAFPRHAVTCVSSGSRCDSLNAWLPMRCDVANGDFVSEWSPTQIQSPRA